MQPRLCVALFLYSAPGMTALIATECSTFVHINCGTSKRTIAFPDGDTNMASVVRGNGLAAHTCLLLLLLSLFHRTFLLEQPGSSVLMMTKRMQWLLEVLAGFGLKVFKQAFWMSAWGHTHPKRTILWSNNPIIRMFSTDKLAGHKLHLLATAPPIVHRYKKKDGTTGYSGGKRLKQTEQLDLQYKIDCTCGSIFCFKLRLSNILINMIGCSLSLYLRHYPPRFAKMVVELLSCASALTRDMNDAPKARAMVPLILRSPKNVPLNPAPFGPKRGG